MSSKVSEASCDGSAARPTADGETATAPIRVVHAVAGRIRFRVAAIIDRPDCAARLASRLAGRPGIVKARARAVTASVIVEHAAVLGREAVVDLVTRAVADSADPPSAAAPRVPDALPSDWHARPLDAVLADLGTSRDRGLSEAAATRRLAVHGPNRLTRREPPSQWRALMRQFKSAPILLLIGSAGLSLVTGAIAEAMTTIGVVVVNGVLGYVTEGEAERTIHRLFEADTDRVTVLRDGRRIEIEADRIVPGDLMALSPGSRIVADARMVSAARLLVDESALTGESVSVTKRPSDGLDRAMPIGERTNMVHAGTLVTAESGWAVVVATGMTTEAARIQHMTETETRPRARLERELDEIGTRLVGLSLAGCGLFLAVGLMRGNRLPVMLRGAVALAVAAVPEGLPMVATTTLARGLKRMQERNILIRHVDVVETLGALHTLCVDKTGTLTLNDLAVVEVVAGGRRFAVDALDAAEPAVARLLEVAALNTEIAPAGAGPDPGSVASATERALLAAATAGGCDVERLRATHPLTGIAERRAGRRFVVTVHRAGARLTVKGSPEEVLARCCTLAEADGERPLTEADRDRILSDNDRLSARPARVLGFAERPSAGDAATPDDPRGLTWLGLAAMVDPLRPGARAFIAALHQAGIETVLITGDQAATALAVARELDIARGAPIQVVDSSDLQTIDLPLLAGLAARTHVFARVSPEQKLLIVRALQATGRVVAMTGDGVNDGPALKAADVGVAMGASGTNLARDVANVLIADDRLPTLLDAIAQGRTVHRNIRRSLEFLITTNVSEIIVELIEALHGPGEVETPLELLWINLVTDVLPGLGLALADPDPDVMAAPLRPNDGPIIPPHDVRRMAIDAGLIAASALVAHFVGLSRHGPGPRTRALTFNALVFGQLLYTLACERIGGRPASFPGLFANRTLDLALLGAIGLQAVPSVVPPLRRLMGIAPLSGGELALAAGAGLAPVAAALARNRWIFPEITTVGRRPNA